MAKVTAIGLIVLGCILIMFAVLAVLTAVLSNTIALLAASSAYGFGRLAGSLVVTLLLFVFGIRMFKSGRRRLAAAGVAS